MRAFACLSWRPLFLFPLLLAVSQASCGDPCDDAPPPPPFLCTTRLVVLADLPADEHPTITRVGTTNTEACSSGGSSGVYQCSVAVGPWRAGTTLDVTVTAPGATPQTVTFVFGAPGTSACFVCPPAEAVSPVDLRPHTVDSGLPPITP